jgi:hypothetical protein
MWAWFDVGLILTNRGSLQIALATLAIPSNLAGNCLILLSPKMAVDPRAGAPDLWNSLCQRLVTVHFR